MMRDFDAMLKRAGLQKIRFHDLRHNAASMMLAGNISIVSVSRYLGHSSPQVTLGIYAHLGSWWIWRNCHHDGCPVFIERLTISAHLRKNPLASEARGLRFRWVDLRCTDLHRQISNHKISRALPPIYGDARVRDPRI